MFVILCAEDLDPAGDVIDTSGSEGNKENSRPSSGSASPRSGSGLSRRQRKNRRREDAAPKKNRKPGGPPAAHHKSPSPPLRHWVKLGLSEPAVYKLLRSYMLSKEQLLTMGYPIESEQHKGKVLIFQSGPVHVQRKHKFDVNAREFVPRSHRHSPDYVPDSGQGSSSSSEEESPPDAGGAARASVLNEDYEAQAEDPVEGRQHTCARCRSAFRIKDGKIVQQQGCVYHHGKLRSGWKGHSSGETVYTCCGGDGDSAGCTAARQHVWSGVLTGFNGPYDFVRTKARRHPPPSGTPGVYAMDCEMVYTMAGMEVARVTVVGIDGRVVYDTYVRPDSEILDYNTRFSGIGPREMRYCNKTLKDVQNDLMGFISADTILIGHSLDNDLRALKMVHYYVIDTAVSFPHCNGLPYRRSLKQLVGSVLRRQIQCGENGHDSVEDSQACMDLMLLRVRKDFIGLIEHYQ